MARVLPAWQREGAIILAIETSNPSAWSEGCGWTPGIALARVAGGGGVRCIDREAINTSTPQHDDLASAIQRLTVRSGVRPRDLACVAVSRGPGGFTNTRVAVVTAKMIAEATGAACVGVATAWVVALRVPRDGAGFGVALASKQHDAHVTRFDAEGRPLDGGAIVDGAGIARLGVRRLVGDAFLPGSMREACVAAGIEVVAPTFDAMACAEAALLSPEVDPAELTPFYPREPEAVTKWRALHAKDAGARDRE